MSRKESNLSANKKGGNTILAVSQIAVNKNLNDTFKRLHLPKHKEKLRFSYFLKEGKAISRKAVVEALGLDSKKLVVTKTNVSKLRKFGVTLAIEGAWFNHKYYDPKRNKYILKIERNNNEVTFTQTFKSLSVYSLEKGGTDYFQKVNPNTSFLQYRTKIAVNDKNITGKQLPKATQRVITKKNYSAVFSCQQLYIDLSKASPLAQMAFDGASAITEKKINTKIIQLLKRAFGIKGGIQVGQVILPKKPLKIDKKLNPKYVPKKLIYGTSYNASDRNKSLLVYHLTTDKKQDFSAIKYKWKWMEPSDNFGGVMAVSREVFVKQFLESLEKVLKGTSPCPFIYKISGKREKRWTTHDVYTINLLHDKNNGVKFHLYPKKRDRKIYQFYAENSWDWRGNSQEVKVNWAVYMKCTIKSGKVSFLTTITGYLQYGNSIKGYKEWVVLYWMYSVESDCNLGLGVSHDGQLTYHLNKSNNEGKEYRIPEITSQVECGEADLKQKISKIRNTSIREGVEKLCKVTKGTCDTIKKEGHLKKVLEQVGDVQPWIFPGGKTLSFKRPEFSKYGDLTAAVTFKTILEDHENDAISLVNI